MTNWWEWLIVALLVAGAVVGALAGRALASHHIEVRQALREPPKRLTDEEWRGNKAAILRAAEVADNAQRRANWLKYAYTWNGLPIPADKDLPAFIKDELAIASSARRTVSDLMVGRHTG